MLRGDVNVAEQAYFLAHGGEGWAVRGAGGEPVAVPAFPALSPRACGGRGGAGGVRLRRARASRGGGAGPRGRPLLDARRARGRGGHAAGGAPPGARAAQPHRLHPAHDDVRHLRAADAALHPRHARRPRRPAHGRIADNWPPRHIGLDAVNAAIRVCIHSVLYYTDCTMPGAFDVADAVFPSQAKQEALLYLARPSAQCVGTRVHLQAPLVDGVFEF
mmetsp:Transcript_36531/g.70087  ORF Transcript_36531/g.70087 Transcript_36531/m.70087 type:complete len:218 (+) Transcript_36531:920-1573(+)